MNDENDVQIEPDENLDDSVLAEESQGATIKKLKEKLKVAEEKAKEYLDGWQRSQAEFVNIRKRDEEGKKEFVKFVSEKLISELMPVLDSFELSLPHGNKELEVIYRQFLSILKSNGVEEENPLGETFDPRRHEAIGTLEGEENKILEVMQKGYILQGKIIRPAKVRIGENKS